MITPPHHLNGNLIDASAGTGKTYQLASRFIALLALGLPAQTLIALTFTRKAAGEFMDRIIRDLAQAASGPAEAEKMWKRINSTLSGFQYDAPDEPAGCAPLCPDLQLGPAEKSSRFFRTKLEEVLRQLASLNLSTLDSFFNKIVSAHCVEMGLGSISLLSAEELERLRFQTLLSLLAHGDEKEDFSDAFMTLFQDLSEDKMAGMLDTLQVKVADFFTLYQNNPRQELWGQLEVFGLPAADKLPRFETETDELIRQHEEEITRLSECKGCSAFATFIRKMRAWSFAGMSRVQKVFESPKTPEQVRLRELAAPIYEQRRVDVLRRCFRKSRGMAELMALYWQIYSSEVLASGKLVFDDVTRAVPTLLNESGIDVARRLDMQLKHWMLDEFQDTSPQQWDALEPLLREVVSKQEDQTLFVVGDEKQSIYAWRGASPELFRMLKTDETWSRHLLPSSMSLSRRSAPQIMDFVNTVFRDSINAGDFPVHQSARTDLEKAGYVRVASLPAGSQDEVNEAACEEIGRILVEELDFASGGVSAAVLVRKNAEGEMILQWLKRHHPELPVALLSDTRVAALSPLGEMLLSFFRWLLHPSDAYCWSVLEQSPLGAVLLQSDKSETWSHWRARLDAEGYAAVLGCIAGRLAPDAERQDATLREWLTEAMAFESAGGTLEDWLLRIENKSRIENSPKSSVHIMTMHKSKGLEYDAVILPMLSSRTLCDTSRMQYLVARDAQGQVQGILLPPASADQRAAWTAFAPLEEAWKQKQLKEARNLLYVALTRARHANYILINGKVQRSGDDDTSFSAMMLAALGLEGEKPQRTCYLWESGNAAWRCKEAAAAAQAADVRPVLLRPAGKRRKRVSPSHLDSVLPDAAIPADGDGVRFGNEVHALFEKIEWMDSLPGWVENPQSAAQRVVAAALLQPSVRALFSPQTGVEVYTEQRLEAVEDNQWISASVDRLLVYNGGAHIIDFKTNKADPDDRSWLKVHYAPQMRAYRRLVAAALKLDIDNVKVSLISVPKNGLAEVLPYAAGEL